MTVEFIEFPLVSLEFLVISSFSYPRLSRSALVKIFLTSSFETVRFVPLALIALKSSLCALVKKEDQ